MSAIINNSFRKFQADNFIESFTETVSGTNTRKNNIYLAFGKTDAWSGTTADNLAEFRVTDGNPASDINIPLPVDTTQASAFHWDDIRAIKRITDVSHVIARYDWTSGTIYREYSHDRDDIIDNINPANSVSETPFYVFTDEFRVYKCISNNNGAASTVKPTGNSEGLTKTDADGYVWKFMFEVQQADVLKYVTADWIPTKTLTADDGTKQWDVQQNAIDGSIDYIKVTAGGTGYRSTVGQPVSDVAANNPDKISLQNAADPNNNTTQVADGTTDDYYNDMTIYITSGPGAGQFTTVTDYIAVDRLATVSPAWDVNNLPTTASVYEVRPAVTIDGTSGGQSGGGSGITARVSRQTDGTGAIEEITIVNRTPNQGTGYRQATAEVTSGSGAGAILKVVINPKGGHGSDPVGELGGAFVMMNARLRGAANTDLPIDEDFRKVHVLVNPKTLQDTLATADTYAKNEITEDTGIMLYTEYRPPIHRSTDSTEDVKLVVEF